MCPPPLGRRLAGAEGFEPSNTGSKVPRLTAWPRPNVVQSGAPTPGGALRASWGPSPHSPRNLRTVFEPALSGRSGPREWPISRRANAKCIRRGYFRASTGRDKRQCSCLESVLVSRTRRPWPTRASAAASAREIRANTPKTAEPLPVIAAAEAPCRRSSSISWPISG